MDKDLSIYSFQRNYFLRGRVSVSEIVYVGQCEVFVCLDFVDLFSLGYEAHRSANGVSFLLKNVDFSDTRPLNSVWAERGMGALYI